MTLLVVNLEILCSVESPKTAATRFLVFYGVVVAVDIVEVEIITGSVVVAINGVSANG